MSVHDNEFDNGFYGQEQEIDGQGDFDGQGKSMEEEVDGAMKALVIALGASLLFLAAVVGVIVWAVVA